MPSSFYRKCSKTHYIRLDFLEQVVLYEVKRLACFASEYENDFIKAMIGRSAKVAENTALRKQRELDALTARDRELDMLFERLYEDNVAGKIDDARFSKMSKRYEQEQGENAKKTLGLGSLLGLWLQSLLIHVTMWAINIVIFVIVYGRMIEIYRASRSAAFHPKAVCGHFGNPALASR